MPHPTKFEDLSDYDQQGSMIATFNHVDFLSLPRKTLIRVLKTVDELLNINRAINAIIRIAADNGVDPFQV